MKGRIFEIKRFAVHDGDGIRTTVFLKGCPLQCIWCHNPEGIGFHAQTAYFPQKCIGCGECETVCPTGALKAGGFTRAGCIGCGSCEEVCLGHAVRFYGRELTVDEVLPLLLEDREFYESSGGGVTLSGGECLCQAEFCEGLLRRLKAEQIHTAVDTCGYVPCEVFRAVVPFTDVFLFDIKAIDEEVHIRCTGQPNGLILQNLMFLDSLGSNIEVRIPLVPDYNDGQIPKIADFLTGFHHISGVRVLPYHNYAGSKYGALGMKNTLPEILPDKEGRRRAEDLLRSRGLNVLD